MPLYYFDFQDGEPIIDDVGTLCRDLTVARREAMKVLPLMAADRCTGRSHVTMSVIVRDEHRRPMFSAALSLTGTDLL